VDAPDKPKRVPRDRTHPLQAYATPDERMAVQQRAAAAGLTLSAYIRSACLGLRVSSVMDLQAVATLAAVNADQARLGNLLKLYLQHARPDHAAATRLLEEIGGLQAELKAAVRMLRA